MKIHHIRSNQSLSFGQSVRRPRRAGAAVQRQRAVVRPELRRVPAAGARAREELELRQLPGRMAHMSLTPFQSKFLIVKAPLSTEIINDTFLH